jgi:predicted SnoaL-like aldol condensation-catalyzing enzyme
MEYQLLNEKIRIQTEKALDLSIDSLSNGQSFSPFVLYGKEGDKLERFFAESLDQVIEAAVEFIEDIEDGSKIVILCFMDKVKLNDGTFDAVITQIYGSDEDKGYSFGHVYKIDNDKLQFLNKVIYLGDIRNCLVY